MKKENIVSLPKGSATAPIIAQTAQVCHLKPEHICSKHWTEWVKGSAISPEIAAANLKSLGGSLAFDYLLYSNKIERRNDGRLSEGYLRRYRFLEDGGWWVNGIDIKKLASTGNEEDSLWGCFKPDKPRLKENGKPLKVEHPPNVSTEIFCLRDPSRPELWAQALQDPSVPIFITEGAKKAACLLSLGYTAIGLPGFTGAVRSIKNKLGEVMGRHLIPEIELFATSGRTVYLVFDQDTKESTIRDCNREKTKLSLELIKRDCFVKIVEWKPELGKGVDDVVVEHGPEVFKQAVDAAKSYELWSVGQTNKLTYASSIKLNQRYLGGFCILHSEKIIVLKSPKGTGKTEYLRRLIEEAHARNQRVLVITHRVQLTQEICDRVGLRSIYEYLHSMNSKEVQCGEEGTVQKSKGEMIRKEMETLGYGLCIDSLHPLSQAQFNADEWKNALIIIDEAEQVVWHLFNSKTLTKNRVPVLQELHRLLECILSPNSEGRLVLSDADMTDVSICFAKQSAGRLDIDPFVVLNEWKPEKPWTVYLHDKQVEFFAALEARIAAGDRVLCLVDSQKLKGKYSTTNLAAMWERKFGVRVLRIDSDTLEREDSEAFGCIGEGLNKILSQYDVVIASPSIETGVSIDIKGHFDSVWACYQLLPANSIRQALARLREPVDRHIYVAPMGLDRIAGGECWPSRLRASSHKIVAANLKLIGEAAAGDSQFYAAAFDAWLKMAARHNLSALSLRDSVIQGLKDEGHNVVAADEVFSENDLKELKERVKKNRHENQHDEATKTAAVDLIDAKEAQKLESKRSKEDKTEQRQLLKYQLNKRYGEVEVTPELVIKDADSWYSKLQLHFFLTTGRQFLVCRDREKFDALCEGNDFWIPDVNRTLLSTKTRVLEYFDIIPLLRKKEFRDDDPDLIKLRDKAFAHAIEIRQVLKFSVHTGDSPEARAEKQSLIAQGKKQKINEGFSPVTVASKFLNMLGLKLECSQRLQLGSNRVRVYKLKGLDDGRIDVFASWLLQYVDKTGTEVDLGQLLNLAVGGQASSTGNKDLSKMLDVAPEVEREEITPDSLGNDGEGESRDNISSAVGNSDGVKTEDGTLTPQAVGERPPYLDGDATGCSGDGVPSSAGNKDLSKMLDVAPESKTMDASPKEIGNRPGQFEALPSGSREA